MANYTVGNIFNGLINQKQNKFENEMKNNKNGQ